ncbi:DUF58 domain-containing protein [bacterium]|nr:DUF58 domain-containing protein [bacterium]
MSTDYEKYLKPEIIAKLSNLEIKARLVVEGFITGLHKSPYHGFSVEFAEHRQYMPGDEIRSIDWKVYGRTSRYYVKRYEEETNLKAYVILDTSGSMGFTSAAMTKLEYGACLAASLSYLMIHQRDAVGLTLFDTKITKFLPPRSTLSYLKTIQESLAHSHTSDETEISPVLHEIAERIKRRGLIILISDLFDDPEKVLTGLKHFRHRGHEVIVFQILDPQEREFAYSGDVIFEDMETKERIQTQPWHIRSNYREQMRLFLDRYRKECRENNIDHVLLDTRTPYDTALLEYLTKRKKMG